MSSRQITYCIAGKFGGELLFDGIACYRQIKSANNYFILMAIPYQTANLLTFVQWPLRAEPPSYMVVGSSTTLEICLE